MSSQQNYKVVGCGVAGYIATAVHTGLIHIGSLSSSKGAQFFQVLYPNKKKKKKDSGY